MLQRRVQSPSGGSVRSYAVTSHSPLTCALSSVIHRITVGTWDRTFVMRSTRAQSDLITTPYMDLMKTKFGGYAIYVLRCSALNTNEFSMARWPRVGRGGLQREGHGGVEFSCREISPQKRPTDLGNWCFHTRTVHFE